LSGARADSNARARVQRAMNRYTKIKSAVVGARQTITGSFGLKDAAFAAALLTPIRAAGATGSSRLGHARCRREVLRAYNAGSGR